MLRLMRFKVKIYNCTGLVTTIEFNDVKNKRPNVSTVVKKTNYDAKILHIKKIFYYFWL